MKDIELRVLIELMKNSRRSDRELAKVLGCSQPTVSRAIKKLEKEGIIKEYTVIPDFTKLGFQIMSIMLAKAHPSAPFEQMEKVRSRLLEERNETYHSAVLMGMTVNGLGFDYTGLILSEKYSELSRTIQILRKLPRFEVDSVAFLNMDLGSKNHFLPLTFSNLARYLERKTEASTIKA